PRPTLFPYTTLFRSPGAHAPEHPSGLLPEAGYRASAVRQVPPRGSALDTGARDRRRGRTARVGVPRRADSEWAGGLRAGAGRGTADDGDGGADRRAAPSLSVPRAARRLK